MKLKLTVAAFLLSAGSAFAGCYTPELEFSIDHELSSFNEYSDSDRSNEKYGLSESYGSDSAYGRDRGNSDDITFGISINIHLGKLLKISAQLKSLKLVQISEQKSKKKERKELSVEKKTQKLVLKN